MKLWLISRYDEGGYDTFDSAVVVAAGEEEARQTSPSGMKWRDGQWRRPDGSATSSYGWTTPEGVSVEYLGETALEDGRVVCASFNAG